jgi:hypothetical protein
LKFEVLLPAFIEMTRGTRLFVSWAHGQVILVNEAGYG